MGDPEFSYPINPPTPDQPIDDPNPIDPPEGGSPPPEDPRDPCLLLQQANEDLPPECDSVHFGTPKCNVDWVYFNNAPCGSAPEKYQNGIGYVGTYFQSFDDKGFFRIEGLMDAAAGQANLYAYAGGNKAFEVYMYEDGLNVKGLLAGQLGSSESCHINVFKRDQQTEIDFQGATNLSFEGAQIFKSEIYKQTIECFVKKYDYDQEWVGLESNILKSLVWGGLDQSNFFRLMYDGGNPARRGFLEILNNGYETYHQIQVKNEDINWYAQFTSPEYYRKFVIDGLHTEDTLNFDQAQVKALINTVEASTYNAFYPNYFATLVSKSNESFVYLAIENGYAFLEHKDGESRTFGTRYGGDAYWDLNTKQQTYFQMNDGEDRMYVAPKDIPLNSREPEDNYASFQKLKWFDINNLEIWAAVISSKEIDLRHLGTCWAKYPCIPVETGPPCIDDLTFGGPNNDKCKVRSFDVYTQNGDAEFEFYQYNYGLDLKPTTNKNIKVAIYTNGSTDMNVDIAAQDRAFLSIRDLQAQYYSQVFVEGYGYHGFKLNNGLQFSYMTADKDYRYLVLENAFGTNWRTAAGSNTADTIIYNQDGDRQIYLGINDTQGAIGYRFDPQKLAFGYASSAEIDFRLNFNGAAFSYLYAKATEGKVQVSQAARYGQMFSDQSKTRTTLFGADAFVEGTANNNEGKIQVSKNSRYGYIFSDLNQTQMTLFGFDGFVEGTAKSDEGKIQVSYVNSYGYLAATNENVECYLNKQDKYAFFRTESTEAKSQVSNGGNYGYIAATSSNVDLELNKGESFAKGEATNSEGKFQVSKGSKYGYMKNTSNSVSIYLSDGSNIVDIDTSSCQSQRVYLRQIDVCDGGTTKSMIVLASDPF